MRLLAYADLQATDGSERCFRGADTSLQQYRVSLFFEKLYTIYEENSCEGLIDLGDTTDDRSAIPVPVIDTVLAGLDRFPENGLNYKIIGNHEQFLRDTSIDVSRLFSRHFTVVNRDVVAFGSTRVVFASYPANHDELTQWLAKQAAGPSPKLLFGHFQVVGARMNSGLAIMGIPREVLDRFRLSLLGHVHLPQTIGSRIHYVGSPFQQNWGEAGQAKRVAIVDTEALTVEWVPLEGFPVYRQADFATFTTQYSADSEDRWRVVLHSQDEAERFYAMPEAAYCEPIHAYGAGTGKTGESDALVPEVHDTAQVLRSWMDARSPQEAGLDGIPADDLLAVGKQLVEGSEHT